jgi:hypothetical protein
MYSREDVGGLMDGRVEKGEEVVVPVYVGNRLW